MQTVKVKKINRPFDAQISVPGSKSYSMRALFISALCDEQFRIVNLLKSDDTLAMSDALLKIKNAPDEVYVNESGIAARFLTALACLNTGSQKIYGETSLNARPIKDLVDALRYLGAKITYIEKDGYMPIRVESDHLTGKSVKISGNVSSQYISALLLIAPCLSDGLEIEVLGMLTSKPYVDITIEIMKHFGVDVINQNYKKIVIKPQQYKARDYIVESDYSSAAYFFAAAALNDESTARISGLDKNSLQADKKLLSILEKMGAKLEVNSDHTSVTGGKLKPIEINMNDCPDQAMTVAVLAAFAKGRSVITGIESLRVKETERIKALENELAKMGIETKATHDSLIIYGGSPKLANIDTYGDHRLAMSFALSTLKIEGMNIMEPDVVNKTFPGFWQELRKITSVDFSDKNYSNILLIGMRGTGKSTTGRLLAKKLGKKFIDMDEYLENKYNMKIRDMVLTHGWEYFRDRESEVSHEISKKAGYVIGSGGGIVLRKENIELFKHNSVVVLLKARPKTLSYRIRKDQNRIELTEQPTLLGELAEVWNERKYKYFSVSDFVIDAEKLNSRNVAKQIIDKIN